MREDLLQFIWKFKYFNLNSLTGCKREKIEIVHPGVQNFNQGPDFLNARIRIDETLWVGNVELHIHSSQWNEHKHQEDKHYNNVILHVVWHFDGDVKNTNGNILPTLVLEDRVSKILLDRYRELMDKELHQGRRFIACENLLTSDIIHSFKVDAWKSRLVAERLEARTQKVYSVLEQTNYHWEEAMWQLIAANFGGNHNSDFFRRIAVSVSQKTLAKHKNQLIAIEAILFGQASLLDEEFADAYPAMLSREYNFYKKKYGLQQPDGNLMFGRMRPANFPTIRLAQLSALIYKSSHLFSKLKEIATIHEVKELFRVEPNDFWLYHYRLNDASSGIAKPKILGNQMIENIIINTVCPVLFGYGNYNNDTVQKEKAIEWLEGLAAENNHITRGFSRLGFSNKNAFDSQALIQLKKNYCEKLRCLECTIGNLILGSSKNLDSV